MRVTLKTTLLLAFCIFYIKAILLPFPKHQDLLNQISQISSISQITQKQAVDTQKITETEFVPEQCPQGQIMGPKGCLNLIMTFPEQTKQQSSQSKILLSNVQTPENILSDVITTIQPSDVTPFTSIQNLEINTNVLPETVSTENIQTAVENKVQQNILQNPEPLLNIPATSPSSEFQKLKQNQIIKETDQISSTDKQQSLIDISRQEQIKIPNTQPSDNLRSLTVGIPLFRFRQNYFNKPRFMSQLRQPLTQVNSSICQGVWIQSLQSCIPSVCPQKYEWNQQTQQCQMPKPKCKQGLIWNGKYCSPLQNIQKEFPKLNQTQQFARQISMKCAGNYCRYPVCPPKFTFIQSTCLPTQKDIKCPKQNINHKGFCDPSYYLTIQNSCQTWNGTICQQKYWNKY